MIKDKWEIFKDFSEGFIIAFRGKIISGLNNELRLQESDLIQIYPPSKAQCKENELIKIEDLKLALKKNNNENYVSKTDLALNQKLSLEEGNTISIYPRDNIECKENELIKIKDLNLDLEDDPVNENNYPLARIIICVIDLLLLAAAITTFLLYFLTTLSFSIAVPIVLTVLCVAFTILLFAWNKILPESWRKPPEVIKTNVTGEYDKSKQNEKGNKIIENDMQTEKNESEENNKITQLSD